MDQVAPPVAKKKPKQKPVKFDPVSGFYLDKDGVPIPPSYRDAPAAVDPYHFEIDTRSVYAKDPTVVEAVMTYDDDGRRAQNAGSKTLSISPRKTFKKGTRWRVTGENVRIEAMCNYGQGPNGQQIWSGWSRHIPVGTIVTCIGWRRFRRDGLVAPQFVFDGLPAEAKWSSVWPHDGVWRPWPLAGILEAVTEETDHEAK